MRRLILALLIAAAPSALVAPAAAQTADEQRQLDWAVERGRLLYALDRAAWVGTDDMREHVPEAQQRGLAGYVVDRDSDGFLTIFYAREGDRLVAAYRGRIGAGGVAGREVFPPGQRPELTPSQRRLAMALEQLGSASPRLEMCSRSRPNVAIIPPETPDGPIDLYVMTPQTETDSLPVGGHHRITLDAQGRITAQRRFTNSCIALSIAATPGQGRPEGLVITHLLDPVPTEIHVFTALAAGVPLYVSAGQSVWEVNGEGIRFVSRFPPR